MSPGSYSGRAATFVAFDEASRPLVPRIAPEQLPCRKCKAEPGQSCRRWSNRHQLFCRKKSNHHPVRAHDAKLANQAYDAIKPR